jgi:ferrochelatase
MRYWHPMTTAAIAEMAAFAPEDLVLLPLYPQYSKTTTGSSVNEWNRCFERNGWRPNVHLIETFYEDSTYLDSVVSAINACLRDGDDLADLDMIFSAHSVPIAVIDAGDPYQGQIEHTVDLVWKRGGWPGRRHTCYQSKVGASKWLRPSMHETVKNLAAAGSKHVLVVPISFVSDHVETLHEIDIEHREQARELGIADYRMMPGLNDSPDFIRALAGLVRITQKQPRITGVSA